jgi:hypothetical protein
MPAAITRTLMKIRFHADDERSLTVVFEPWGGQYLLEAGDYLDVLFAPSDREPDGSVEHRPGTLVLTQEGPGVLRAWDSAGEVLDPAS